MKIGRYLLVGVIVVVGAVVTVKQYRAYRARHAGATASALPVYDEDAYNTHAPDSVHILVEVINATKTRGLARRATAYLRDRGFDVVFVSTTNEVRKETLVLDRSNHPQWAQLVAKAMHAKVDSRPDTTRYIDATVLIGSDWTPPALPFYP